MSDNELTLEDIFAQKPEFTELLGMWDERPDIPRVNSVVDLRWAEYYEKFDDIDRRDRERAQQICAAHYPDDDPEAWSTRSHLLSGIVRIKSLLVKPEDAK